MKSIDADKLGKIGKGILDLGLGMVAFAGGRAAGGLADIAGGIGNAIGSLFGAEDKGPLHMFAEISKDKNIDANRLAALGGGISDLALGLKAFAAIDSTGLAANSLSAGLIANLPTNAVATFMEKGSSKFSTVSGEGATEFKKALNMNTTSQENALAGAGGGQPIIINNNNVDNSMQSSQTTAVSIPAPTRTNESTVRALQMSG